MVSAPPYRAQAGEAASRTSPVIIVDYGIGNTAALINMFDYIGVPAAVSSNRDEIACATHIVLPGVGAFDRAMEELHSRDLVASLTFAMRSGRSSMLGVCLGMHLLARSSEEGRLPGLGWIAADVLRLPADVGRKVPHIGWADTQVVNSSPLFPEPLAAPRFYYVHSYHMRLDDPRHCIATVDFGAPVAAVVSSGMLHGAQFHPEKSHRFGMRLLAAFARSSPCVPA